jgi:hypothetical protein
MYQLGSGRRLALQHADRTELIMKTMLAAVAIGMMVFGQAAYSERTDGQLGAAAPSVSPTLRCRVDRLPVAAQWMSAEDIEAVPDYVIDPNVLACQSYVDNLTLDSIEIDRSHCHYLTLPSAQKAKFNFSERFAVLVFCDPIEYTIIVNGRDLTWN